MTSKTQQKKILKNNCKEDLAYLCMQEKILNENLVCLHRMLVKLDIENFLFNFNYSYKILIAINKKEKFVNNGDEKR